ncbi:MAG: radical SAM protein [Candidatus Zixiibacteriota bacterium]|nr:MAG: radical SAM protein [candidate division Zixibacteria bacterium]
MKVLLVRPDMGAIPGTIPPLGLLSLAGYSRERGDYQFRVMDCRHFKLTLDDVEKEVRSFHPDLVGITGFTLEKEIIHQAAQRVKTINRHLPVVVGGPYATASKADLLQDPGIDFAVVGEGELVFQDFLERFAAEGMRDSYEDITSLAYRGAGGEVRLNSQRRFVEKLDDIPMVAWDLIDVPAYFTKKNRATMNLHRRTTRCLPMVTTRGCPFHCTYCHDVFGKKLRKRSVEHVLNEINYMVRQLGVKEIEIIDDIFNLDKARAKAIFEGVIDSGMKLGFSFPNGLRADAMDEDLVDTMKRAGVYRLIYAIESGSPRIQKLMRKNLNLVHARRIVDYTARKNISTGGFFMFGFLDETEEEVRMTIDFACDSRMHTASFFILQPFPNTEIFNQALRAGIILPTENVDEGGHYYRVTHNLSRVSTQRLEKLRDYAARRFWLNPLRVIRFVRSTPIRQNFFHKLWITLRIMVQGNIEKEKSAW